MSSFIANISKGRTGEYHERVNNNDPAPSGLKLVVLAEAGLEADDVLIDYDTLAAVLAGASNEVTNTNYARKTLTDADIGPRTVDDTQNRAVLAWTSSQTFSLIGTGDAWRKLVVCYAPDVAGADSTFIPVSYHDLLLNGAAISPDGVQPIVLANPNGYVIAT